VVTSNTLTVASGTSQSVRTNAAGRQYQMYMDARTTIAAVPGSIATIAFVSFATEATYDKFYVYQGADTLATAVVNGVSGSTAPSSVSGLYGTAVLLRLTSDSSTAAAGVQMTVTMTQCPAGSYCPTGGSAPLACPAGWCPAGSVTQVAPVRGVPLPHRGGL
jgi:hypothetical protein